MYAYVKMGLESSYGGGSSSLTPLKTVAFNWKSNRNPTYSDRVDDMYYTTAHGGPLQVQLNPTFNFRYSQLENLWYMLYGTPTANVYQLGTQSSGEVQFFKGPTSGGLGLKFKGVGVAGCKFTFESKKLATVSPTMIAQTYEDIAYSAPSYTSEQPWAFDQIEATLNGDVTAEVRSITLDVNRALDTQHYYVDSPLLQGLVPSGPTIVTGTITFAAQNVDEIKRAIYGSSSATSFPTSNDLFEGTLNLAVKSLTSFRWCEWDFDSIMYHLGDYGLQGRDRNIKISFRATDQMTFQINEE